KATIKDVEDYAFYVAKATEGLIGKAIFAGHSLGGAIAQILYLKFKSIVDGLILIGTGARLRVLPQILDGLRVKPEETIDTFISYLFGEGTVSKDLVEATRRSILERREILLKDLLICDRFDLLEDFKSGKIRIEVPTLVIVGEKDRLTPVKYSQFFHSNITLSKLYIIKDAGHMVMVEKPDELNKILSEFITSFPWVKI
ncbi:MAG: alpha/beta hydrolase, partial [Nitrososphaerota archaeon]|nr:alpha/beta hydrolase [Nitrososphaerota archaeon]